MSEGIKTYFDRPESGVIRFTQAEKELNDGYSFWAIARFRGREGTLRTKTFEEAQDIAHKIALILEEPNCPFVFLSDPIWERLEIRGIKTEE